MVDLSSGGDQRELVDPPRDWRVPIIALLASAADNMLARHADDFVLQPIDAHHARRRAKALRVYLYLKRGRLVLKCQILGDLWPDAEAADPGRVKHTVQVLRSTLEEFESELAAAAHFRALNQADDALEHYRRGLAMRREMFVAEFRYDDWAAPDIARLQELFLEALENAAQLESAQAAHDRAVDLPRRATLEDPRREGSYMQLMRELWLGGRRVEALRSQQSVRETLART